MLQSTLRNIERWFKKNVRKIEKGTFALTGHHREKGHCMRLQVIALTGHSLL